MSKFKLTDKTAIVTGGGRGIGKGIALEFARAGANVVIASRNRENLENVAAEIRDLGRESLVVPTDVCIEEQVENMVKQTMDRFGRIDILVTNSGVGDTLRWSKMEELDSESWRTTIDLNLTGTFLCSTAVGRIMIKQKKGKIINIASVVGLHANPIMSDYSASKAGVISLTRGFAKELGPEIRVNCIAPGLIQTRLSAGLVDNKEKVAEFIKRYPLKRLGQPNDIAPAVVFLASDASSFMTGAVIVIDGGTMA